MTKIWNLLVLCILLIETVTASEKPKQENTHSHNWLSVWQVDGSYVAAKKDRTLWQLGEISKVYHGISFYVSRTKEFKKVYFLDPEPIMKGKRWKDISIGVNRVYAIGKDGTLWGWGREIHPKKYVGTPVQIGRSHKWKTVETVGSSENGECSAYTLAYQDDGTLWGWGDGDGQFLAFLKKRVYARPQKLGKKWKKVAMGCYRVYALKADDSVWTWGIENKKPKKIKDKKAKNSALKQLKKQHSALSLFYLKLGDKAESRRINGIRGDGSLWLLPIDVEK